MLSAGLYSEAMQSCNDSPCSNFHKPAGYGLWHDESARLTGFNRVEHAGELASYTVLYEGSATSNFGVRDFLISLISP